MEIIHIEMAYVLRQEKINFHKTYEEDFGRMRLQIN